MATDGQEPDSAVGPVFRARLRGEVFRPNDDGYDESRTVWNAMIDQVLAGLIVCPLEDAPAVLRDWQTFTADAPDDLSVWAVFLTAPEESNSPADYHGQRVVAAVPAYSVDTPEGEDVIAPPCSFGGPLADTVEPRRFVEWQQAFDDGYPADDRYQWKPRDFTSQPGEMFEDMTEYAQTLPTAGARVSMTHLGGAVTRVGLDQTAHPHRNTEFVVDITTRWQDPARDEECIVVDPRVLRRARQVRDRGDGRESSSEREDEKPMIYRENYDRLVELKDVYDSENPFRMNQNIEPTVERTKDDGI